MSQLLTLSAVAAPFVIAPGASFTLTLAHSTRSHSPGWLRITLGTAAGIILLALGIGATGLGAALTGNPAIRIALGLVGAMVLIGFGVSILIRAARPPKEDHEGSAPSKLVRWSFAAIITNPKALTLYALVVPTLSGPNLHGLALFASFAAIHIAMLTIWLCLVHHAVLRIPALTHSPRIRNILLGAAGLLMICLGLMTGVRALN